MANLQSQQWRNHGGGVRRNGETVSKNSHHDVAPSHPTHINGWVSLFWCNDIESRAKNFDTPKIILRDIDIIIYIIILLN